MPCLIAPSLLSADFAHLRQDVEALNQSDADWLHIDVMDGVFVPNISFGFPVLKAIKKYARKPLDVHLMIVQPERYVEQFAEAGAASVSAHIEACPHLHRVIQQIKATGVKAGVAINPHTPIEQLRDVIGDADLICLMAVNPGFGGQQFIERTYRRVEELKALIIQEKSNALIEIDGGVTNENAARLAQLGADVLIAGNAVFAASDMKLAASQLKALAQ